MHQRKAIQLLKALPLLVVLCFASATWASTPDWMQRNGTIGNALKQGDNSSVALDCVVIDKIKTKQRIGYFVIRECFSYKDRVVVLSQPNQALRLGMNVDVSGTLVTLPNGCRAIVSPTVLGYTDSEGILLTRGGPFIKGLLQPTSWDYKVDLTVRQETGAMSSMSASETISPNDDEPNATPAEGTSYYSTVAEILEGQTSTQTSSGVRTQSYYDGIPDVRGLPDGSLVELQCKGITAVGTDNINGTNYNYLDLIENPPATDTIRAYYSGTAATTDRVNKIFGQIRHVGTEPVICTDSGPGYDPQILEGGCQLVVQGSLAWVKTVPDGYQISTLLTDKIASGSFPELGIFYIQEQGGVSGIRVASSLQTWPEVGQLVSISGCQITTSDHERILTASANNVTLGTLAQIRPLGMNNKAVTGGPFNVYTPGATGAFALNNVGTLIRTWGRVTSVQPNYLVINDGSDSVGIKVDLLQAPGSPIPHDIYPDDYVVVTGIASIDAFGSDTIRVIKPRNSDDLDVFLARPRFTDIAANPCIAKVSDVVTITFTASKQLSGTPTVTVNGHSTTTPTNQGLDYTCQYTIQSSDPAGDATIAVTGIDLDGNQGSTTNTDALTVACIPVITAPTGTIGDLAPLVTWTVSGTYDRYQVQLVNIANQEDAWDSGEVIGTVSSTQVTRLLANNATYSVKVRIGKTCGWGEWSQPVEFGVIFTEPPLPSIVPYCGQ